MSSESSVADAWKVSPQQYAQSREPEYRLPSAPRSRYLTMRDGCRLAIDVYLPHALDGGKTPPARVPALLFFTPYYRRFKMADGAAGENNPNTGKFRDYFVPRGYAVVVIDVRGTGASFGTRDSFRSPREREDSREVADWVAAQPWCDGTLGATGVSYLGAAADFLASTGHPAVKAIAPLFSVWDTYIDNYFPGGIQLKALTQSYDDLMVAMDHDRREMLSRFVYYANPDFRGPHPVDEDADGELARAAVREHLANFRQTEFMPEFRFREEGLPYDPSFSSASFSPYAVAEGTREDVAVLSVSGWMDGAGYANGAIARFLTLSRNPRHLLLGPWDHGARIDVSPWRKAESPDFPLLAEILRFFDHYLMGLATGLDAEEPVHYFSMHAQQWHKAGQWPPLPEQAVLHLDAGAALAADAGAAGSDDYQVDFTLGTGQGTRYERIAAINSTVYYPDWQGRTGKMLSYTSAPLPQASELAGHVLVECHVASSEPDAALFLYLTEIEADGTERYVTEGLLRALHRKESPRPPMFLTSWPFRSFRREDAAPMVPGRAELIRVALLPTAWRFAAGSRIRFSIAGADADHCGQVPHGRPPRLTVLRGAGQASRLVLPLRSAR